MLKFEKGRKIAAKDLNHYTAAAKIQGLKVCFQTLLHDPNNVEITEVKSNGTREIAEQNKKNAEKILTKADLEQKLKK